MNNLKIMTLKEYLASRGLKPVPQGFSPWKYRQARLPMDVTCVCCEAIVRVTEDTPIDHLGQMFCTRCGKEMNDLYQS